MSMEESLDRPTCVPGRTTHRWGAVGVEHYQGKRYATATCVHCDTRKLTLVRSPGAGAVLYLHNNAEAKS